MEIIPAENPWLDEITATNPYTYNVMMNIETAKKTGVKEGDIGQLNFDLDRSVDVHILTVDGDDAPIAGVVIT